MKKNQISKLKIICILILCLFLSVSCKKKNKVQPPPEMVLVPAGEFLMGTNNEADFDSSSAAFIVKPWYIDESPERKVYLDGFFIDKYESTNLDYEMFVNARKVNHRPGNWNPDGSMPEKIAKWPVAYLSWYDVIDFCSSQNKRLLKEAEWEKAARGEDGNIYPWGNTFDLSLANLAKKSGDVPDFTPVGSFPKGKSKYGVYDMIGNAWEWVYDEYKPYPGSTYILEEFDLKKRVVRGVSKVEVGHYPNDQYIEVSSKFARAGYRNGIKPLQRIGDIGVRCAKNLQALSK